MALTQASFIWEFPDVLLFTIVSYIAAPTHRATILCHRIAPLCKAAYRTLLQDERTAVNLWDTVLVEDYGVQSQHETNRRACKRLRRSPVHRVRDAHRLINDNTEIAYFYLAEMVNSSSNANKLSKARMISLLDEYGPHLRLNRNVSSGGLYLVEVCRAKHVTASVVLKCVQELVENRGAMIDLKTSESDASCQTALCVAAARGMCTVVEYLLFKGASPDIISSGRFTLHTQPKKSVRCNHKTALEFAVTMRDAEKAVGAADANLAGLSKCVRLLEQR